MRNFRLETFALDLMHTHDMLGLSSIPTELTEIISTVEGATVESDIGLLNEET